MKLFIGLFFILALNPLHASIFGSDDRIDISKVSDEKIVELARSIPAMVKKNRLVSISDTHYKLVTDSYIEDFGFCEDEKFVKTQSLLANCSAFLIGDDVVGSAGHCIDDKAQMGIDDYAVVFDYKADEFGNSPKTIKKENVYFIEKVIKSEFEWKEYKDYILMKLTKPVIGRAPLKMNHGQRVEVGTPLFVIGYPLGLPQKYQPGSKVISINDNPNSFRHHLDTYSVNSGSAVFSATTHEIVGIHVRGTGFNMVTDKEKKCKRWQVGDPKKDWGEANFIDIAL